MNTADFITELYCRIEDALPRKAPHPQARLSLSELVTIGVLHAIKNVKQRPFIGSRITMAISSPNCRNAPASSAD